MKSTGEILAGMGWTKKFDEAIRWANVRRSEKILRYGWPHDCECDLCGDTGIDPELQRFCTCAPGVDKRNEHERNGTWIDVCPELFLDYRLETHPDQASAKQVRTWVQRGFGVRRNLLLSGPVGTGKSGLAIGAMHELHMRGYSCKFDTFSQILNQLRPRDDYDKAAKRENLESLIGKGLLVIDDLGTHKETEWTAQQLFDLVNERIVGRRPFIITTNMTLDEMAAALDDRLMSRFAQTTDVVMVVGEDLRRNGRAA